MGTFLSKALGKYYEREGNRLVFINGMSLNQLALAMWERLGYREIDASVVSRVISGERFFTPSQLQVFCELLSIPNNEREYLFYCLNLDNCAQYGVKLPEGFFSFEEIIDLFENMVSRVTGLIYKGRYLDILSFSPFITERLRDLKVTDAKRVKKLLGRSLSNEVRAIGGSIFPWEVNKLYPYAKELLKIAKEIRDKEILSHYYQCCSYIHYISGNYSSLKKDKKFFLKAISYAKKAFNSFEDEDPEKFFALRNLFTSAIFIKDRESFLSLKKEPLINKMLINLREEHFTMGVHLFHTIARGEAVFGLKNPWKTYGLAEKYFGKVMEGKGVQEVADIRNELEMISIQKMKGDRFVREMVKRFYSVAGQENCVRQMANVRKMLPRILN